MSEELAREPAQTADEASHVSQAGTTGVPALQRLGRYRLIRELASGGMATVNLAVAEGLDKLVALKIIHANLGKEESFVRMFLDEARLASAISHRNVCNVFDFGEAEGRHYIAMDFLAGQTLRDTLVRLRQVETDMDARVKMEPRRLAVYIAYVLAEVCEGLHAAHELTRHDGSSLQVVHRDVSPHNLFITYDGHVSVVDFGIARARDREQDTVTGVLKGKFSYMAPEQMRQLEIDRRADVWALGVCLWESLTLRRLFVRSSHAETVMSVMTKRVRPPSELRPDLPKELDQIVLRALSRNREQRYATAREMGRDLMKLCRESGVPVGPLEIEQFMARLFPQEIERTRELVRMAKRSSMESSSWLELTPSGFPRVPTHSGALPIPSAAASLPPEHELPKTASPASEPPRAEAIASARPSAVHPASKRAWVFGLAGICLVGAGALHWWNKAPEHAASTRPLVLGTSEPPQLPRPPEAQAPFVAVPLDAPAPSAPEPADVTLKREKRVRALRVIPPQQIVQRATAELANASQLVGPNVLPGAHTSTPSAAPSTAAPVAKSTSPQASSSAAHPRTQSPAASASAANRPLTAPGFDASVTMRNLEVEGALGIGVVGQLLMRATPAMHACYTEAARRAGHNEFSPLPARFAIDELGTVRLVSTGNHPLPGLSACVTNALLRVRSERLPDVGTVQVRLEVVFAAP